MQILKTQKATIVTKKGTCENQSLRHASSNGSLGSDEEDEQAELLRELEKIKRERAEQREREVCQWLRHFLINDC